MLSDMSMGDWCQLQLPMAQGKAIEQRQWIAQLCELLSHAAQGLLGMVGYRCLLLLCLGMVACCEALEVSQQGHCKSPALGAAL